MNEREQLWTQWFLGVFGTAGLFAIFALMGMAVQHEKMGWLSFLLGALAFFFGPWLAVGTRPPLLGGGMIGLGVAIGAIALLIIFTSIYEAELPPPLALVGYLVLGFLGGAMGEPHLGTAT